MSLIPSWSDPLLHAFLWPAVTVVLFLITRRAYRRWRRWWLSPVLVAPAVLVTLVLTLHVSYQDYMRGSGWLLALLGPVIVAFAVPIYEQRALIRRHWPVLTAGMIMGSATAVLTGWMLATMLGLDDALRLSLLPRSISTPFAMEVSGSIGGMPELTGVFVMLTGILGALIGEVMLVWLPVRSALARGALLGVGAHAAGTAKAHEIGSEEGSIAGLVMVLAGLMNVLAAPVIASLLR